MNEWRKHSKTKEIVRMKQTNNKRNLENEVIYTRLWNTSLNKTMYNYAHCVPVKKWNQRWGQGHEYK